jgi:hypothetical protein
MRQTLDPSTDPYSVIANHCVPVYNIAVMVAKNYLRYVKLPVPVVVSQVS